MDPSPSRQPPREAAALSGVLGGRITALRTGRGWSLSALAARASIGKATLSEIEAGRRNPTLETLYALAAQLQVPLAGLLVEPGTPKPPPLPVDGDAVQAQLLEVFTDGGVTTEVYRLVIQPGTRQVSPGHGTGVTEHLHVLAGTVLAGPLGHAQQGGPGSRLIWHSAGAHEYVAIGPEQVQAVLVIRTPRPGAPDPAPAIGRVTGPPAPGSL